MFYGDESTRVAVDAVMALFYGQDLAAFEYRANVWVWWTKVAIQYVLALVALQFGGVQEL